MTRVHRLVIAACSIVLCACSTTATLRTQRLEIVDSAGNVHGVFESGAGGNPSLSLLDNHLKALAELWLVDEVDIRSGTKALAPCLSLTSSVGDVTANVIATSQGALLDLFCSEKRRMWIEANERMTRIMSTDDNGHEVWARIVFDQGAWRLEPTPDPDEESPDQAVNVPGLKSRATDTAGSHTSNDR
jgi:hypothetical protein